MKQIKKTSLLLLFTLFINLFNIGLESKSLSAKERILETIPVMASGNFLEKGNGFQEDTDSFSEKSATKKISKRKNKRGKRKYKKKAKKASKKPSLKSSDKEESLTYVVNRRSKKFHYDYCRTIKRMKAKNRLDLTTTREDLISQGYSPCKVCYP